MSDDFLQSNYPYPVGKPFIKRDGTTWQKYLVEWRITCCRPIDQPAPEITKLADKDYLCIYDEPPY